MAVRPEDVQHLKEAVAGMKRNGWTIEAVKALELRKYDWPGYPNREEKRKEFLELWNAAFPEQLGLFQEELAGSLDGVDREKLKKAIEETEAILHSSEGEQT